MILPEKKTKVCVKCGKELEIDKFHIIRVWSGISIERRNQCKTCYNEMQKERYLRRKERKQNENNFTTKSIAVY